jgi:hypothetical protein
MNKIAIGLLLGGILGVFDGLAARLTPEVRPNGQPNASASTDHDFDFLVGTWEFTAVAKIPGAPPTYPGIWTAKRTGDDAVVEDAYKVVDDQGVRRFLGVTYRAFDAKKKLWTTAFVVPPSGTWKLGTAWREGDEIWEGSPDESKTKRARFYDIAPDHFHWIAERSTDGGMSWSSYVQVEARRVPAK